MKDEKNEHELKKDESIARDILMTHIFVVL